MGFDECPQCWAGGSQVKEFETTHHYIHECYFCGCLVIVKKDEKTPLERVDSK